VDVPTSNYPPAGEEIAAQAAPAFSRFLEPVIAQCRELEAKARDRMKCVERGILVWAYI
jgi:hypothetical protein